MRIVIYTQRVEVIESYGERRDCADQNIARFIQECGFFPLAVPNVAEKLEAMVASVHPAGILLTGGNSLVKYGGNALERDQTDRTLIQLALENNLPLYGFCRGMQSILDYFKCPLENVDGHVAVRHLLVGKMQGTEVNSFHNQGAFSSKVKKPLLVLAQTEDGVAEYISHENGRIQGTMWHPEREKTFRMADIIRVRSLFDK